MQIYTSYFGNIKALKEHGIIPVSIARWLPKWYNGISLKEVAPTPSMLKDDITRDEYIKRYNELLQKIDVNKFLETLKFFTNGQPCALICYEKPNEFCHRHLLADYLNSKLNLNIEEFKVKENIKAKENKPEELSLF